MYTHGIFNRVCHNGEFFQEPSKLCADFYVLQSGNVGYLGVPAVARPCHHGSRRGSGSDQYFIFSTLKKIHAIQTEKDKENEENTTMVSMEESMEIPDDKGGEAL